MEREKVIEIVAKVRIPVTKLSVSDQNFVRFAIQPTGGKVNVGPTLFVFDHRPATLLSAKVSLINQDAPWKDHQRVKGNLVRAVQQPAKVVVMKKFNKKRTFYYVNLYPVNKEKPSALFSQTSYRGNADTGLTIKEDRSLWSWTSESSSPSDLRWKMILVALTDEKRRITVKSHGCLDSGQPAKSFIVISDDIRQIAEEELL